MHLPALVNLFNWWLAAIMSFQYPFITVSVLVLEPQHPDSQPLEFIVPGNLAQVLATLGAKL